MKTSLLCTLLCCSFAAAGPSTSPETTTTNNASPNGEFMAQIVSKKAEFTEDTVAIVSRESGSRISHDLGERVEWEVRIKVGMDYRLEILFVFHVQLWRTLIMELPNVCLFRRCKQIRFSGREIKAGYRPRFSANIPSHVTG